MVSRILSIADRTLKDLQLETIGYASCHLAVRVLLYRFAAVGIEAVRIPCILESRFERHGATLINGKSNVNRVENCGHVVCGARSGDDEWVVIDLTIGQLHDLNPMVPRLESFAFQVNDSQMRGAFDADGESDGVEFIYHAYPNEWPFPDDLLDWNRSDEFLDEMLLGLSNPEYRKKFRELAIAEGVHPDVH
jgi:hypothetical protein